MKNILCVGDWGYEKHLRLKKFLNELCIEEIFCLGDNFYPNGIQSKDDPQWENTLDFLFKKNIKKYVCLGNHDYIGDVNLQMNVRKKSNWNLPFFFHDRVDNEYDLHIFFIDSQLFAPDITIRILKQCFIRDDRFEKYLKYVNMYRQKQLEWLREKLESSKSKFKIVCGHYPVYSNGPHEVSRMLQNALIPLFEEFNVDLYLSGHDHNVQCIQKGCTTYIISGGVHSSGYEIKQIRERGTQFWSNDSSVIVLQMDGTTICVNYKSLESLDEKTLKIIIKQ